VRSYVTTALGQAEVSTRSEFAAVTAVTWVASVRTSEAPEKTSELVQELVDRCGSDQQRLALLIRLYIRGGDLTPGEHALLRSSKSLFLRSGQAPAFVAATARTLRYEWPALKTLVEEVLQSIPSAERSPALRSLVESVNAAVHGADPATVPTGLGVWLLDQLLQLPDLDDIGGNVEWYLEDTLKLVGRVPLSWLPRALAARSALEARQDGSAGFHALGYHTRLSKYVKSLTAADATDEPALDAVRALLDLGDDHGTVGHYLPEVLRDVDPEGQVVPAHVAQRLGQATVLEDARRLARIGGAYVVGGSAWRTIAKAALQSTAAGSPDTRRALFGALTERGIRSFSGKPGEVPSVFTAAVDGARAALNAETDADLRPFWEWRLAGAEAELRDEQERAKEERGE
jgi:hypothetical protein